MNRIALTTSALFLIAASFMPLGLSGQLAQGGRGAVPVTLPTTPTAVSLPTMSQEITGPGPMFDSTPSLPSGKGLAAFRYQALEYFVSGTANGQPYQTRLVVRRPINGSASAPNAMSVVCMSP